MTTIDLRTRFQGDEMQLEPSDFLEGGRCALSNEAHAALIGSNAAIATLAPLTLDVEGDLLTFEVVNGRVSVRRGGNDALVVALDRDAFSDLMQDVSSTFGLHKRDRAVVQQGTLDSFIEWEPMLRCLLDGRPVYERGDIDFTNREGGPLDLHQSFTLDDSREDIGHFLAEAGFLHIKGVFTESEMASVSSDFDEAIEAANRDDGASWWARTEEAGWYPSRILGFNLKSPALRHLLHSDRFASVGSFTSDHFVQDDPDVGDTSEALWKKVGVIEGISDVSWHKDCSMGGHSRSCCRLVVGISVTDSGPDNGELGVVPGSHRANIPLLGIEGLDLPLLPLPTRVGDLTVHCSCTLHMSRRPVSAERRVIYAGFSLAPRPGDTRVNVDLAELRRQRAALNDHTRRQQREIATPRMASHEL